MSPERVRELVAQQRAVEARRPPQCPPGSMGDVVVCVLSSALISAGIVKLLIEWWLS